MQVQKKIALVVLAVLVVSLGVATAFAYNENADAIGNQAAYNNIAPYDPNNPDGTCNYNNSTGTRNNNCPINGNGVNNSTTTNGYNCPQGNHINGVNHMDGAGRMGGFGRGMMR